MDSRNDFIVEVEVEQYGKFATLYDLFMEGTDYDTWAQYLASFIEKGSKIVECGCGTGEITIRLKKLGYEIIGVDISEAMLSAASKKACRKGLNIQFVQMDMCKLVLHRPVDCVIVPCDGINYLTSVKKVEEFFKSANLALKSGGRLIFDISSRYKLSQVLGLNTFSDSRVDAAYIWRNNYDEKSKLIEMNLEFFKFKMKDDNGTPLFERFFEKHIQRAHSERELCSWLENAGFEPEAVYADFTREAPENYSERLQFIARKS